MNTQTRLGEKQWYYELQSQSVGPIPEADLRLLAENGTIEPNAFVWTEGMSDWQPALAVMPRAFEDAELPHEQWNFQYVIALILATVAIALVVVLVVIAALPKKNESTKDVVKVDNEPSSPQTTKVDPKPEIPNKSPNDPEKPPPSSQGEDPTPKGPVGPSNEPENPSAKTGSGSSGSSSSSSSPPNKPPGSPNGSPSKPGVFFLNSGQPVSVGMVRLTNTVAIRPGAEVWVYVDDKKTVQWFVGKTDVEVYALAGKHEIKVISTFNQMRIEVFKQDLDVIANKVIEVPVNAKKK